MKIRLTSDRAAFGLFQQAGEVIELPRPEARQLIAGGQAEPIASGVRSPESGIENQPLTPDAGPRTPDTKRGKK